MAAHSKTLNPKQLVFAQAMAQGKSYAEASRIAGYSGKNHRIDLQPLVAAEIERQREIVGEVQQMSADWWRTELVYQYNKVRESTNATDALRALEIAGKHLGLLGGEGDRDLYDQAARLMNNATTLMALQMAAQSQAKEVKTVDAFAHARGVMGLPEGAPAHEEV